MGKKKLIKGRGKILRITKQESKGKTYYRVKMDGERFGKEWFSVWDGSVLKGVRKGDFVSFGFIKSGKFKNIKSMEKSERKKSSVSSASSVSSVSSDPNIRVACLKAAVAFLDGDTARSEDVIELARRFEEYVEDG